MIRSALLRYLDPRVFHLASVAVLPALDEDDQGVEPEEDYHRNQDPLDDNPNRGIVFVGSWNAAIVFDLLDCCLWILQPKGESSPHSQVEQDEEGDHLRGEVSNIEMIGFFTCRPGFFVSPSSMVL